MTEARIPIKTIQTIERHKRLNKNGNPRYTVKFTDGSAHTTAIDAMVNYTISNYLPGQKVEVLIDYKSQNILAIAPVEDGPEQ